MCSQPNITDQKSRDRSRILRERLTAKQHSKSKSDEGDMALSPVQNVVWAHEQRHEKCGLYTVLRCWRISGDLKPDVLHRALEILVKRQAALRILIEVADGTPKPIIKPESHVDLKSETIDIDEQENRLSSRLREISLTPLDLETGPVFAFHLLRLNSKEHVFCALIHHIVTDDWSYGIFANELGKIYSSLLNATPLPEIPVYSYEDHLKRPRNSVETPETVRNGLNWPHEVSGSASHVINPCARSIRLPISRTITDDLRKIARSEQVTLYSVLVAAYQFLLGQYCGQQEVTVGVSYVDRPLPEIEKLIGMFVRMGGLDAKLKSDESLRLFAELAQSNLIAMQDGAARPETIGIDASIAYYNTPEQSLQLEGLQVTDEKLSSVPISLPLHLAIRDDDGGLEITFIAREAMFSHDTVEKLAKTYQRILTQFADNPEMPISEFDLVDEVEKRRLAELSTSNEVYPQDNDVPTQFEAVANKYPDKTALTTSLGSWRYDALNLAADKMANWLRGRGATNGAVVGVCLPRGAQLIIATLGAMKAGAVVAPIDPAYPDVRLQQMIETSECTLVLCRDFETCARFPEGMAYIAPTTEDLERSTRVSPIGRDTSPSRAAYLIFTSGSTGRPKAVITPHSGVVRLAAGLFLGEIGPEDRIAQLASPSFDASFIEIWGALLNGGNLVSPEGDLKNLHEISDFLCTHKITIGFFTTGLFNLIIDEDPNAFASFRWLSVGGESLSPLHINKAYSALPNVRILNVYGPTENSALTTSYEVISAVKNTVPIGIPLPNNMAFVLSDSLTPLPTGFAGELCIGGPGLALGYKNLPEETATKFVSVRGAKIGLPSLDEVRLYRTGDRVRWSRDSQIEFLGRIDSQIKLNGYRIEPGEIARALEAHPDVHSAIVIPQRDEAENRVAGLIAFYESHNDKLDDSNIRTYLGDALPYFLMPTKFHRTPRFPLTLSGKVDRDALLHLAATQMQAETPTQRDIDPRLVRIWSELLRCEVTSAKADFFALGGHSLLAMRMLAQVEREFDCKLDVAKFLNEPYLDTLLAQTLSQPRAIVNQSKRIALLRDGDPALTPVVCVTGIMGDCMWAREIVQAWPGDRPIYGISFGEQSERAKDPSSLNEFAVEIVEEIKNLFDKRPVHLVGYSFGAFLAFILAGKMKQAELPIARIVMLDGGLNLTKLSVDVPEIATQYPKDLLKRLYVEHNLSPLELQFDLIICRRGFPGHNSDIIQPWAIFANNGLRIHEFDTFHTNIIYGKWAARTAKLTEEILSGKEQIGTLVSTPRWPKESHNLLRKARQEAIAGDTKSALATFEKLSNELQPLPSWIYQIFAELHCRNQDRKSLRNMIRKMQNTDGMSSESWMEVAGVASNFKFRKIAHNCLMRAAKFKDEEFTGKFRLASLFIKNDELVEAENIAKEISQTKRWEIEAQLIYALVARKRDDKERALSHVETAMAHEDIGLSHIRFALLRILAPYDTALACDLVYSKLEDFRNNPKLVAIRDDLNCEQT